MIERTIKPLRAAEKRIYIDEVLLLRPGNYDTISVV
jgi:hypothetical protein